MEAAAATASGWRRPAVAGGAQTSEANPRGQERAAWARHTMDGSEQRGRAGASGEGGAHAVRVVRTGGRIIIDIKAQA